MKFKIFFLASSLVILGFNYGRSQGVQTANRTLKQGKYDIQLKGTLGTYANPPRLPNGKVDEKRLISELKEIHANTYNWLIRTGDDDLTALKHFLPLTREAGINVWVTLVPPSEPPPSEPFRLDYDQWASELAALSKKEPTLVAWSIDDFINNIKFYSPEYVKEFQSRAHAINPKFAFVPCCYFKYITETFVASYAHLLDGILFPYRAASGANGPNLKDASLVASEISKLRSMLGPNLSIILDVYASPHSRLGSTTSEYVQKVIAAGLQNADGVMIYTNQDPKLNSHKYEIVGGLFATGFSK